MKTFIKLLLLIAFISVLIFSDRQYKNSIKPIVIKKHIESIKKVEVKREVVDLTTADQAIYIYFGNDKLARAIAKAESGLNCKVVGFQGDNYGLFQINAVHLKRFTNQGLRWDNCLDNAKVARQIWEEREAKVKGHGWLVWGAFTDGSYKKHL